MRHLFFALTGVVVILIGIFGTGILSAHADRVYTDQGRLAKISPTAQVVIVKVPVEGQHMTVGGPLVKDATLTKGNRQAVLRDFDIGGTVTVKWQYTHEGDRILELHQR
jgi:hypothetical protein